MISAEQFLDLLEEKDLLPAKVLLTLRQQIDQAGKPVAATTVARELIKAGHLTPALAERLLTSQQPAKEEEPEPVDELGLAPLEEDEKSKKKSAPKTPPPEEDLGLTPLDDVPDKAAKRKTASKQPEADVPSGLIVVGDADSAPAAAPKTPAAKKSPTPVQKPKQTPQAKQPAQKPAQKPALKPAQKQPAQEKPAQEKLASSGGGSLLDEELSPLDESLGGGPLDDLMAMEGSPLDAAAGSSLAPVGKKKGLRKIFGGKRPPGKKAKVWDSPLMLVGGGVLLVLVILLVVFVLTINRESGDKMCDLADEDYRAGSYTQAIHKYDAFLEKYSSHPRASLARVHRGLALMRQTTEGASDWSRALDTAKQVLGEISVETDFKEAHGELSSLLPAIAEGLANQARKTPDPALVAKAREALAMVNSSYVPKSLRNQVQLDAIDASLGLTERELARESELAKAIEAIGKAVEEGKPAEAYELRAALLKEYPDLVNNADLAAVVAKVSQAQASLVMPVEQKSEGLKDDPSSPVVASVALARKGVVTPAPGVAQRVVFALGAGSIFGLDAAEGGVLWQRSLGQKSDGRTPCFLPTPVSEASQTYVLLVDMARNELLCVESATGKLRWRHPLEGSLRTQPAVAEGQALVVAEGEQGCRLVRIDLEQGTSSGYVEIPQPVRVAPVVDVRRDNVYLVAEHSNLYVLSLADGHCKEVFYLGHRLNSITVAPVAVSRFLMVADNERDCLLRVLTVEGEGDGPKVRQLQQIELKGRVDTPPLVADRRLATVTDIGAIDVFGISGTDAETPLGRVGERGGEGRRDLVRFPLLANGQFWVAGDQLSRFDIQAARGRLMPKAILTPDEGSVFVQPLASIGQTLYHARYDSALPGLRVSAIEMTEGKRLWESEVATPPAGEPIVDAAAGTLTLATAAGAVFCVDAAALTGGSPVNRPLAAVPQGKLTGGLACLMDLGEGRLAMAGGEGAEQVLFYDPKATEEPVTATALPGPLSCQPIVFSGRVLAPCKTGLVALLEPREGKPQIEPFQPTLRPGAELAWRRPALVGNDEFVVTDGGTRLYRVGIKDKPKPFLAAITSVELTEPIASPLTVAGESVFGVDRTGMLLAFALPDLKPADVVALDGRCVWGPETVGEQVLLATDHDELLFVGADRKVAGRAPLTYGPLAGRPLAADGCYVLASASGVVWKVKPPTGDAPAAEIGKIEVGLPLAAGPVLLGGKLVVVGRDGSVYEVPMPEEKAKP